VSVRKFDFDKWWNTTHNGSSPTDMVARVEAQKAWDVVSELYEAEHNSEYKQCHSCRHELCKTCKKGSNFYIK